MYYLFIALSATIFSITLIVYAYSFRNAQIEATENGILIRLADNLLVWFRWIALSLAWAAPPLLVGSRISTEYSDINWATIIALYAIIGTIAVLGLDSLPGNFKVVQPRIGVLTTLLFGIASSAVAINFAMQTRLAKAEIRTQTIALAVGVNERQPILATAPLKITKLGTTRYVVTVRSLVYAKLTIQLYSPVDDSVTQQGSFDCGAYDSTKLAFSDDSIECDYFSSSGYTNNNVKNELSKGIQYVGAPAIKPDVDGRFDAPICSLLLGDTSQLEKFIASDLTNSREDIIQYCKENQIWCFFIDGAAEH